MLTSSTMMTSVAPTTNPTEQTRFSKCPLLVTNSLFVILFLYVTTWCPKTGHAYPSGAGDCPQGRAAVNGAHLGGTTGTLESAGFHVLLDGTVLNGGTSANVATNKSHTISIVGSSLFTGFLIRIGGSISTTHAFTVPSNQSAIVRLASDTCGSTYNVGGITQTDGSDKQQISATLQMNSLASSLPVDVTVVIDINSYYYTGYTINSVSVGSTSDHSVEDESNSSYSSSITATSNTLSKASGEASTILITSLMACILSILLT